MDLQPGPTAQTAPVRTGPTTVVVVAIISLTCTTLLWAALVLVRVSAAARTADPYAVTDTLGADDGSPALQLGQAVPEDDALTLGDCFLEPRTSAGRLMVVDCVDPHDGEVFAAGAPVAGWDTASPESQRQLVTDLCLAPFADFTGEAYEDSVLEVSGAPWGAVSASASTEAEPGFVCILRDPAGVASGSARSAPAADLTTT